MSQGFSAVLPLNAMEAKTLRSETTRLLREGLEHLAAGRWQQAEFCLREVLKRSNVYPDAWHGLGILALQTGHYRDAVTLFESAIALVPRFAPAHVNLGNALKALGRFEEAVCSYRSAIALQPDLFSAWNNIGEALQALGKIDNAVQALEHATELIPDSAEVQVNLGNLYKEQGRIEAALSAYDRALEIDPYFKEAYSNKLAALKVAPHVTPEGICEAHRRFSAWFETVSREYQPLNNNPDPDRKLRIGYVSPDCHPAVPAFMRPVLRGHDASRFEVFCYFNNTQSVWLDTVIRQKIQFRVMAGLSDRQVAERIRSDGIDILIDIAGHTGKNRLLVFARRPAPVQMTWLDYLGTTGLAAMDYRISDAVADPPGATEKFYSETLLRIAPSQWCWEPDSDSPPVAALPAARNGFITFGSFNNYSKIGDDTLRLWAQILARDGTARLVVAGTAKGRARNRVMDFMGANGTRVNFLARLGVPEYRRAIGEVDVALDPLDFSGATTTLDALWQRVSVLTCPGLISASRSSASLLEAVGLQEWVAQSQAQYVEFALTWRERIGELSSLREVIRERLRASPLLDARGFTQNLEALYCTAWRRWCDQHIAATTAKPYEALDRCYADSLLLAAEEDIKRQSCATAIEKLKLVYGFQPDWVRAHTALAQALLQWSHSNPACVAPWPPALAHGTNPVSVSIIICSIDDAKYTRIRLQYEALFFGYEIEVIRIPDARSLSEGYNRGASLARGEVLIFSHDDVEIVGEDFAPRLLAHMDAFDVVGLAGTTKLLGGAWDWAGTPHVHGQIIHRPPGQAGYVYLAWGLSRMVIDGIEALDGVLFAARRHVWEKIRFDETSFDGFHLYDVDFSYRCFLEGFRLAVVNDLLVIHESTGKYDRVWQKYNLRFRHKFSDRITGVPIANRTTGLNIKLQQLEQVQRLRVALAHFHFPLFADHC